MLAAAFRRPSGENNAAANADSANYVSESPVNKPAEPLAAGDRAFGKFVGLLLLLAETKPPRVVHALMRSLLVLIGRLLPDDVPQMRLAEYDEMIEAILLDGLYPAAARHGG